MATLKADMRIVYRLETKNKQKHEISFFFLQYVIPYHICMGAPIHAQSIKCKTFKKTNKSLYIYVHLNGVNTF